MSCASRAMEVDLEFTEPFYGIVYADFSRSSACSFVGKGGLSYHYELPLTGCGTIQVIRLTTLLAAHLTQSQPQWGETLFLYLRNCAIMKKEMHLLRDDKEKKKKKQGSSCK